MIVIAHEFDPRAGAAAAASARRRDTSSDFGTDLRGFQGGQQQQRGDRGGWQGQQRGYQGRGGGQQQQHQRMSEREAREVLAENDRRRQQRVREADRLSAPKGAELEDLASSGAAEGGTASCAALLVAESSAWALVRPAAPCRQPLEQQQPAGCNRAPCPATWQSVWLLASLSLPCPLPRLAPTADSSEDDDQVVQQLLGGAEKIVASGDSGAAPKKRRGRPPKAAASSAADLQELPPGFLDQRRASNPRDHPEQGGNVEYP